MISIKEIESFKDYGRVLSISNGVIGHTLPLI